MKKVYPERSRGVFLDSSILVAASASKKGGSAFILGLCREKKLKGYLSLDVIGEARKNVNLKLKKIHKQRFIYFLKQADLILVPSPSVEEIAQCEKVINPKDAPILAAALKSPTSFLITLDRKDFLKPKVFDFAKPLKITTPGDFISKYL